MSATNIEWCDLTINPVVGCSPCSPGCRSCYAERFAARLAKNPKTAAKYAGVVDGHGKWTGRLNAVSGLDVFMSLSRQKKQKRVFVGSMTDIFHENMPYGYLECLVRACESWYQHTFCFLTKRPRNLLAFLKWAAQNAERTGFGQNIWLGVTVCNQDEADKKIPILLQTPAAKRFVSVEPMLGPVNLRPLIGPHCHCHPYSEPYPCDEYLERGRCSRTPSEIDWVICGGESGPNARHTHPDWVRSLRDQCQEAGVPFFFKKFGKYWPVLKTHTRLLDGREWNEVPE